MDHHRTLLGKHFVRPSESREKVSWTSDRGGSPTLDTGLTGEEAKVFYESLISSESKSSCPVSPRRRLRNQRIQREPYSRPTNERHGNFERTNQLLLAAAQHNRAKDVSKHLSNGGDINCTDSFGWTPLMIAAYEGHTGLVRQLLFRGSDISLVNKRGDDARQLAQMGNRRDIVRLLDEYSTNRKHSVRVIHLSGDDGCTVSEETCELCHVSYPANHRSRHVTSTIHQSELSKARPNGREGGVVLPSSSRGYQLLLRSGWNEKTGLGPQGREGRKFPLPTLLKKDRAGLGVSKVKPRVTHFEPGDVRAVECAGVRPIGRVPMDRRRMERLRTRDKHWERDMRLELGGEADGQPGGLYGLYS